MALRVKEPFSFDRGGVPVVMRAGVLVSDDDACVAGHENFFEPAEDVAARFSGTSTVETATAAPGEGRALSSRRGKTDR